MAQQLQVARLLALVSQLEAVLEAQSDLALETARVRWLLEKFLQNEAPPLNPAFREGLETRWTMAQAVQQQARVQLALLAAQLLLLARQWRDEPPAAEH